MECAWVDRMNANERLSKRASHCPYKFYARHTQHDVHFQHVSSFGFFRVPTMDSTYTVETTVIDIYVLNNFYIQLGFSFGVFWWALDFLDRYIRAV